MNHKTGQLEAALSTLETRIRQARADTDYLHTELARLIASTALGENHQQDIDGIRRQLADSRLVIDETPAALEVLKGWIEQAREEQAQEQRTEDARQALHKYFQVRKQIITNPVIATQESAGGLWGLASQLDLDVDNYRLKPPPVKFYQETRKLISSAVEYCHIRRDTPFSFTVMIPEGYDKEVPNHE